MEKETFNIGEVLPEFGKRVLATNGHSWTIARLEQTKRDADGVTYIWTKAGFDDNFVEDYIHWQELPELPKATSK